MINKWLQLSFRAAATFFLPTMNSRGMQCCKSKKCVIKNEIFGCHEKMC